VYRSGFNLLEKRIQKIHFKKFFNNIMEKSTKVLQKEYEEIISKHPAIKKLRESALSKVNVKLYLTGGAVIDILDGREPKDFDFIVSNLDCIDYHFLLDNGFTYDYTTTNSVTFSFGKLKVQLLRVESNKFDFSISTSLYSLKDKNFKSFPFLAYLNKELSFKDRSEYTVVDYMGKLSRIPHWNEKGYKIHNYTYFDLLNKINKKMGFVLDFKHSNKS